MPPVIETPSREIWTTVWRTSDVKTGRQINDLKAAWQTSDRLIQRRQPSEWRGQSIRRRHLASHGSWREVNPSSTRSAVVVNRSRRAAIGALFSDLADRWEAETALESIVARKAVHPAYQRIIGMGDRAVPLILRRLQREPRQWFWALTAITGEDPAQGETTVDGASDAWLRWGRERGLVID